MKFKYALVTLASIFILNGQAQSTKDEVLFTVDDDSVYVSEFLRVYNKNLDLVQDESQKNVDEYLKLFTNYKLKLKEAKALKLDEKATYKHELGNYKKQLAKNYMTDGEVTEALVKEAYDRISYDVKANHILIKIPENAKPQDTINAYNAILKLRERTLKEGFDKVRKEVHNGQTIFGEELGYFSGFKMVYKFENVAFNTSIGDISKPFRTRFGYHIVNVQDKRKSKGERTVAHIMVASKQNDSLDEDNKSRIQDIYKRVKQGEAFEALAKQFSDDKSSASNGGKLAPFSKGQISSQTFEDTAFTLQNENDISQPFKTKFGWHIVKLLNKKPIPAYEDVKFELEQKVKRDSRSKRIDEALTQKLKAQYKVELNPEALDYFASILNDDFRKRRYALPTDFKGSLPFLKIEGKTYTYSDFGDYLLKNQRNTNVKLTFKALINNKYQTFLNSKLITYKEDNLEYENEEFANILGEYRDGLLLFDLMETTIWNTAKTDTTAIKTYYDNNKSKYVTLKRVDAVIASSPKQKTLKKVSKLLREGFTVNEIKAKINTNDDVQVIFTSEVVDANHQMLPKDFQFKKGVSEIYSHNDAYIVVQVNDIIPSKQKTFDDAKGSVISDYQDFKEHNWLKSLSEKYNISVNSDVLLKVKKQINKG